MKLSQTCPRPVHLAIVFCAALLAWSSAAAEPSSTAQFRSQFLQLCDLATAEIRAGTNKQPFFIDSYAVRALGVAYDLTGKQEYLDACRAWSERMIGFQDRMLPRDAYCMNYGRKPGENKGAWYVADSSSIAMGVLATAVRCNGAEKQRFLGSAKSFAKLVMDNYIGPSGGIRNGLWPKFDGEWWCCSGIFASLAFLLYDETGDERYLKTALGAVDWLNALDPEKDKTYPLSEMGPTYPMYVLEGYSAGISHLRPGTERRKAALARISWYLDWTARPARQASPRKTVAGRRPLGHEIRRAALPPICLCARPSRRPEALCRRRPRDAKPGGHRIHQPASAYPTARVHDDVLRRTREPGRRLPE